MISNKKTNAEINDLKLKHENLVNQINELNLSNINYKNTIVQLQRENNKQLVTNNKIIAKTNTDENLFDVALNAEDLAFNNGSIASIATLAGDISKLQNLDFRSYIFILAYVKYFRNYVLFDEPSTLSPYFKESFFNIVEACVYNGIIAVSVENQHIIIWKVSGLKYNIYGKYEDVECTSLYTNESRIIKYEDLAIFKFNSSHFSIWVLFINFVMAITKNIDILKNITFYLNVWGTSKTKDGNGYNILNTLKANPGGFLNLAISDINDENNNGLEKDDEIELLSFGPEAESKITTQWLNISNMIRFYEQYLGVYSNPVSGSENRNAANEILPEALKSSKIQSDFFNYLELGFSKLSELLDFKIKISLNDLNVVPSYLSGEKPSNTKEGGGTVTDESTINKPS